jgi:hypothetical protein
MTTIMPRLTPQEYSQALANLSPRTPAHGLPSAFTVRPRTAWHSAGEGTDRLRGAPKYYDRLSRAHPPIAKTKDIEDETDRKR